MQAVKDDAPKAGKVIGVAVTAVEAERQRRRPA